MRNQTFKQENICKCNMYRHGAKYIVKDLTKLQVHVPPKNVSTSTSTSSISTGENVLRTSTSTLKVLTVYK